jgi:sterol desaturase/sphingolipid hydroxylase (fatty acid hydroxylase superfamily)
MPAVPLPATPTLLPWLLAIAGGMLLLATLEGLVRQFVLKRPYDWRAYAVSIVDAIGRRAVDSLGLSIALPAIAWAHQHRLWTLDLAAGWQWLLLFVGEEFAYYGYHRAAHRVRWFWATHSVHHSPNELTLATAVRLGWTGKLTGTGLFFMPLVWLGFEPLAVFGMLGLNLLYQFWLHTTWIPKLGPLEWVFNTPSHHRVHHGSNPEYLDCNYGGVLIVFDRLFGSFVEERADLPPRYGLTTPLHSYNPLRIALHGWIALARDLARARSAAAVLRTLFGPPAAAVPAPAGRREAEREVQREAPREGSPSRNAMRPSSSTS